jgi:hypothetical protein
MTELTEAEAHLLRWLSLEDFSQYGECYGAALDGLVAKGLAQIHEGSEHQGGFIAKGTGPMYRAVSLTERGWSVLNRAAYEE